MNISCQTNESNVLIFLIYGTANILSFCNWSTIKSTTNAKLVAIISEQHDHTVKSLIGNFDEIFYLKTYGQYLKYFDHDELDRLFSSLIVCPTNTYVFSFNEVGYETAIRLRRKFNLAGQRNEKPTILRSKIAFKNKLSSLGILCPSYQVFDKTKVFLNAEAYYIELSEKLSPDFIVKPENAAGSYGVELVNNVEDFVKLGSTLDNSLNYFCEEYIDGALYHVDTLITNSEIVSTFASEYNKPLLFFKKGFITGSIPLFNIPQELMHINQIIVDQLEISYGILHTEVFFSKKKQKFIFLESTLRPGGALIIPCYEKTYGCNLVSMEIVQTCGKLYPINNPTKPEFAAWAYIPPLDGKIKQLFLPTMNSLADVEWFYNESDITRRPNSLKEKLGRVLLTNKDYDELKKDFNLLSSFSCYQFY